MSKLQSTMFVAFELLVEQKSSVIRAVRYCWFDEVSEILTNTLNLTFYLQISGSTELSKVFFKEGLPLRFPIDSRNL